MALAQLLVAQAELLHLTRRKVVDENIGAGEKRREDIAIAGPLEIERDAALAPIEPGEMDGEAVKILIIGARKIAAVGPFHLDDIGAEVGHLARAKRRGHGLFQCDHADAGQRQLWRVLHEFVKKTGAFRGHARPRRKESGWWKPEPPDTGASRGIFVPRRTRPRIRSRRAFAGRRWLPPRKHRRPGALPYSPRRRRAGRHRTSVRLPSASGRPRGRWCRRGRWGTERPDCGQSAGRRPRDRSRICG